MKAKTKNMTGLIVGVLVLVLAAVLFTTLFVKMDKLTTTETISAGSYSVGGLNANGVYQETEGSIYTKKNISADGLTVKIKKEAKVTYKIYFYDAKGGYISATEELTANFESSSVPDNAVYAKIVITPAEDEDGKISWTEKSDYAKALTVTVNKK